MVVRSLMLLEGDIGMERVEGSPRPGKEVRRILRVCDAILLSGGRLGDF